MSPRLTYAIALCATIAIGLAWRSQLSPLTPFLKKYGGVALWAMMLYWIVRCSAPSMRKWTSAALTLAISFLVEIAQLYHAPWIDAIRATRLGAAILGSVFHWPDFPAYTAGVILALLLDRTSPNARLAYPAS